MAEPFVIWIASNAGGVGKTTLAIHVGYRLAQHGVKTLLVDLDTNGSLARFCGLRPPIATEEQVPHSFPDSLMATIRLFFLHGCKHPKNLAYV